MLGDGRVEWGPGNGGRDVNLYSQGGDKLKTDDLLITALGLGVGNSASASALGTLTRKMQVYDASGASLGYVPIYSTIT